MKNNYQEIIDKFGDVIDCQMHYGCNHSSHITEVRIGDVLKKIDYVNSQMTHFIARRDLVLEKWRPLDYSKSLSEIVKKSGYEKCGICSCKLHKDYRNIPKDRPSHLSNCRVNLDKGVRLKDPKATELFQLLKTL